VQELVVPVVSLILGVPVLVVAARRYQAEKAAPGNSHSTASRKIGDRY
jgi:cytochrome c-type biogenesis protein CcmH/NrfF